MSDSIFTKIIKGEIPCHKVYEDDKTLAFMDIHPIQSGHVLVIPKKQISYIWDMAPEDYQALMSTVQKVGQRLRQVFPEKDRVAVIVEGLDMPDHAHVKVFPFSNDEEFRHKPDMKSEPDHEGLAIMAKRLAF